MKNILTASVMVLVIPLSACSGVQHMMPVADSSHKAIALTEIQQYQLPIQKTVMSDKEAEVMLHAVYEKLLPAAKEICEFVDEHPTCWWDVDYSNERTFNAYANKENHVVVYHDVMTHVSSEDELAMVLAHEMGHHIAEHLDETKARAATGAVLGALAMAALSYNAGPCYSYSCTQNVSNAI